MTERNTHPDHQARLDQLKKYTIETVHGVRQQVLFDSYPEGMEVKEDMNYIIDGDETGLIGYWPFAKPATTDLITDWASDTEGENNLSLVDGAIVSTR